MDSRLQHDDESVGASTHRLSEGLPSQQARAKKGKYEAYIWPSDGHPSQDGRPSCICDLFSSLAAHPPWIAAP
eukprot:1146047-Pelagomonas_calceolata.AAC.6